MKISKVITHTFTVVVYSWLAFQYISYGTTVEKVNESQVAVQVQDTWKSLKKDNLINGTILIKKGSEVVFSDGDLEKTYPVASISKTLLGNIYLKKSKEGLDLQTPVCRWLKNFCVDKLKEITLLNLLDHTSGFDRDIGLVPFLKRSFDSSWTLQDIDSLELTQSDLKFAVGEKFEYSNFGYLVLSRVLETLEGRKFSDIVNNNSESFNSAIQDSDVFPRYVLLPWSSGRVTLNFKNSLAKVAGAGGMKASATGLMAWLEKESESLKDIFPADSKNNYSMGWVRSKNQSYQAYWHNGASPGFYSLIAVIPNSDLRIVILSDNYKFIKQWSEKAEAFEQYFY